MNPPIEELLFTAASAFDDERERAAFLDHACRDDRSLRRRMDKLLEMEAQADTFFEFQPEETSAKVSNAADEEGIGVSIGRYRLIAQIGAGGCGAVYYAEQKEPVRRKVALKIVKLGMDTEAVITRFAQERQALALMDHPNIARVLDAGATAAGRPYFVMELVDGQKITDFCDSNKLSIGQRLELFIQVCRAIQHAHQKGIMHRDIKPSNVLVKWQEGVPLPKVIDFGIAKATAPTVAGNVTSMRPERFLGTPAYMSPEQAQGSVDLDTRTDIYSLGIMLYELLCGRTPFDLHRLAESPIDEVRRIVCEEEPTRPSAVLRTSVGEERATVASNRSADPERLLAWLEGDLDWIVIKAVEKERPRRYQTANGLAADISRYLNDDVVSARPPSRTYLLSKLVRRNKLIFVAGSIAIFGLLAGLGTSTWLFLREKAAREEQARLRQRAELRELITRAAVRIQYGDLETADKLLEDVPVEQTPSSLEAVEAFGTVGEWHMEAGRFKEAASRLTAMAHAIADVDSSDVPNVSLRVLPAAAILAYIGEAQLYEDLRRMAVQRFDTTANPVVAEEMLKACLLLPADNATLRTLEPMAGIVQRAIESKQGLTGKDPNHTAWAYFSLSLIDFRRGEYSKAHDLAERCLKIPNRHEARTSLMLIVRAMIEHRSGEPAKAVASLAAARPAVEAFFATRSRFKVGDSVSWVNWICASVFLSEAERLIGNG